MKLFKGFIKDTGKKIAETILDGCQQNKTSFPYDSEDNIDG